MSEQYVFFKQNGTLTKVDIDEIIMIEVADNNYIKFWLAETYYIVRSTLYAALNRLPANHFIRIHKSHAVSIRYISKIEKDSLFFTGNEVEIPVSRQHFRELKKHIMILDAEPSKKEKFSAPEKNPFSQKPPEAKTSKR
jgi:DNA-binding LytR/AlgR family response regulator